MAPRYRLAVGWLTLFVVGTDLFVISPLLPALAAGYGVTPVAAGLGVTVFSVAYMMGAPALGGIADRCGRRATLAACLAAFALANWLTAVAPDFGWLLAARTAAGLAASGVTPLIYAGISEAAPAGCRARWMAIAVSGLLSALCLGAPVGSLVAASFGARLPFLGLAGLSFALALANRALWPAEADAGAGPAGNAGPVGAGALAVRLAPTVLWATALYGMYTYLGVGLAAAGYRPEQTARAISLYGLAALAGTLIGGRAADRFGTRRTILASLAGLAAGLALLGLSIGAAWPAVPALMLSSIVAQLFFPAQQAGLARDLPRQRATALAWNNSALFLGISLGSLVGGQAVALGGFPLDAAIGAILVLAAATIGVIAERGRRLAARSRRRAIAPLARLTAD